MRLVLASGSPYRRALLERLRVPFSTVSPAIDESARAGETPRDLAMRLSRAKAEAVAHRDPTAIVIGSDQVASLDGRLLAKPGSADRAREQLLACSGRCVTFETGLALRLPGGQCSVDCVTTRVWFRALSAIEAARYVALDRPLDCAGSFKWEALGIVLFERLAGDDPTALEGLPLITLSRRLREAGIDPLAP